MKVILISGKARCVDADTEYFNGNGWKKICDYQPGDKVLQYNNDGTATLVTPDEYISMDCEYLWEINNTKTSQCVTDEHRCFYITSKGNLYSKTAKEIIDSHANSINGFQGRFITTFSYGGSGIKLTDDEIRLMCAVICDSSFTRDTSKCFMNLKKERKQNELREILKRVGIPWEERTYKSMPGYIRFIFEAPIREKEFSAHWYNCSAHQLEVICDNICKWDGHTVNGKPKSFTTTNIKTAEFLQFAYASIGKRVSIGEDIRENRNACYQLSISDKNLISLYNRNTNGRKDLFERVIPYDGKCYCFSVHSGMLVLRRNRKIFVTGNSGKDTSAEIFKKSLENLGCSVSITHYADLLKFICKNYFGWNGEKDEAGRRMLQYVGTDVIRKQNPNLWVDFVALMLKYFHENWDYVIIPDCRFPNEVSTMVDNGFDTVHIRVVRDGFKTPLTEEQQKHPSETALDDVVPDYHIHNDGTLDDLTRSINNLIKENLYGNK